MIETPEEFIKKYKLQCELTKNYTCGGVRFVSISIKGTEKEIMLILNRIDENKEKGGE